MLIRPYQRSGDVPWGAAFPWDVFNPGELLGVLTREKPTGDQRQTLMNACLQQVEVSQALAWPAGKLLLELAFDGKPDLAVELSKEQRTILTSFAQQPWAEKSVLLRDWGLIDLDATRAALGLEPLGGTSELSRTIIVGERSATIKTLWQEAIQTDARSPSRDDFVAGILAAEEVDVWCCYLEGLHIDPPSIKMAGFPSSENAVGPVLLEALVSDGTTAEVMRALAKFARRCLVDRTALPRPLNDSRRLWAALLSAGTVIAPHACESSALETLDEVALEKDKTAKGRPDQRIAAFISALPTPLREKRVLMLMNHSFDSGGFQPSGHRYAELAPTKRVATQALASIEAVVKGGMFGTMGARTKKRRRELRDGNGALWACAMVNAIAPRLLELAQEPILFDKHDDRDVFASMLAQLTPPAAAELVLLLDDKVKAIRTIALDGLKRCSSEQLKPHLEFLRSSRKKNHKVALAALEE